MNANEDFKQKLKSKNLSDKMVQLICKIHEDYNIFIDKRIDMIGLSKYPHLEMLINIMTLEGFIGYMSSLYLQALKKAQSVKGLKDFIKKLESLELMSQEFYNDFLDYLIANDKL